MTKKWINHETWMALDPLSRGIFTQLWLWMQTNNKKVTGTVLDVLPMLLQVDLISEQQIKQIAEQQNISLENVGKEKIQRWFWKNFWWLKFKEMLVEINDEQGCVEWDTQWKIREGYFTEDKIVFTEEKSPKINPLKQLKPKKTRTHNLTPLTHDRERAAATETHQARTSSVLLNNKEHLSNNPCEEWQTTLSYDGKIWVNKEEILSRWRMPLNNKQEKFFLWEEGPKMLTDLPQKQAVGFLSKMIKQYGEVVVAKSLTVLALKNPKPLSPASFLRGIIKNEINGFDDEKIARENKGGLVL